MSDAPDNPSANGGVSKARRWFGPALLVSLGLNLFLLGVIATAVIKHHDGPPPPQGPHGGPMSFMFGDVRGVKSDMTDADRAALRKMMLSQITQVRPHLDEMDAARKELAIAVGQVPYDPAKVEESFVHIEKAQAAVAAVMRDTMIKGFATMSQDQRQRVSKIMEKNAEREWKHRPRADGDNPPPPPPGDDGGPNGPPPPPADAPQ